MSTAADDRGTIEVAPGLKRELKVVDAAAFSIGLIGPVGGMALLGAGAAGLLGQGATWAFLFALVGVALVAYGFIKLSQHISHTGSVYALVGRTLGPRAGFVAGCALFAAYTTIGTGSTIEIGLFFDKFLTGIHIGHANEWIWSALIALVLVAALSLTEIRVITRVLLVSELIGAALVTILSIVILVRTGVEDAPGGQKLNFNFLHLSHGTGMSTIAGAAVFGFLAFAGFEGAAALGEETLNPKRDIPKALTIALVVVGAFFVLTIISQSVGYGTGTKGVASFIKNGSPYGDLGTAYVGSALAVLLNLVASISLFAITLGTLTGASRVFYALARDATGANRVTRLSKHGAPLVPFGITMVLVLCFMIAQRVAGTAVLNATFYWLTVGTLALLAAYALATMGAFRFLFMSGPAKAPRWQAIIPVLALVFVIYTIYKNWVGVSGPYRAFPYIIAAWLILAMIVVFAVPGLADRVRDGLAGSESQPPAESGASKL